MARLTPAGVAAMDPQFSPDGTRLACSLYPLDDRWAHDAQIAVIDLATRAIDVLTPGDRVLNYLPRWSPDGETIAFVSDRSGFANVWVIAAGGGEARPIAPRDEEVEDLCWAPDGRRVAYTTNSQAEKRIVVAGIDSGDAEPISTEPGVHSDLVWFPDGAAILGLHQSPQRPPNLIAYAVADRARRWLTDVAVGGLDPDLFADAEHVSWRSTDGLEVYGILLTPKEIVPNGHPALVLIHGGPTAQSRMDWDPTAHYFVSRGWVVIKPNFRGSRGYGRAFTDLLHGAWSQGDLQDNVTSVSVLRERGLVDERCVVAWGGSGGGLATFACLTMAPERFAAGVALYGVADFLNFPYQADRFARDLIDSELAPRAGNLALWTERSPLTHVAAVDAPLLVLHGDVDRRVPLIQSETMVEALRRAGKAVEFHVYEGEGHGWRKCATIQDYIARMDAFLVRHVLNR
jgi:dipeptidyl aminopeptidase/acylaminoacyl peptidase